ncbi:hypothetical protein DL765_005567 [Monosporascus sp. GIB2]|nr:hypothetical protein DL765_005567 [Monosporascus sp. GIB2]
MVSSANNTTMSGSGPGGGVVLTNVYNLGDRGMAAGLIKKQTSAQHDLLRQLLPTHRGGRAPSGPDRRSASRYVNDHTHTHTHTRGIRVCSCTNATGLCLYTNFERDSPSTQDPPIRYWPLVQRSENETKTKSIPPKGRTLHILAKPPAYRPGDSVVDDEQQPTWTAEFSSRWLTQAPSGFSVFEGAIFAVFASGNGKPLPIDAPKVGLSWVRDVYFGGIAQTNVRKG